MKIHNRGFGLLGVLFSMGFIGSMMLTMSSLMRLGQIGTKTQSDSLAFLTNLNLAFNGVLLKSGQCDCNIAQLGPFDPRNGDFRSLSSFNINSYDNACNPSPTSLVSNGELVPSTNLTADIKIVPTQVGGPGSNLYSFLITVTGTPKDKTTWIGSMPRSSATVLATTRVVGPNILPTGCANTQNAPEKTTGLQIASNTFDSIRITPSDLSAPKELVFETISGATITRPYTGPIVLGWNDLLPSSENDKANTLYSILALRNTTNPNLADLKITNLSLAVIFAQYGDLSYIGSFWNNSLQNVHDFIQKGTVVSFSSPLTIVEGISQNYSNDSLTIPQVPATAKAIKLMASTFHSMTVDPLLMFTCVNLAIGQFGTSFKQVYSNCNPEQHFYQNIDLPNSINQNNSTITLAADSALTPLQAVWTYSLNIFGYVDNTNAN